VEGQAGGADGDARRSGAGGCAGAGADHVIGTCGSGADQCEWRAGAVGVWHPQRVLHWDVSGLRVKSGVRRGVCEVSGVWVFGVWVSQSGHPRCSSTAPSRGRSFFTPSDNRHCPFLRSQAMSLVIVLSATPLYHRDPRRLPTRRRKAPRASTVPLARGSNCEKRRVGSVVASPEIER
jgi:hypothetical protein